MTTSRATLTDLEAAHERVRTETGEAGGDELAELRLKRDELQATCAQLYERLDAAEAELAALRRVEAENLNVAHEPGYGWSVFRRPSLVGQTYHPEPLGQGNTLAEALADYDAKKEQR